MRFSSAFQLQLEIFCINVLKREHDSAGETNHFLKTKYATKLVQKAVQRHLIQVTQNKDNARKLAI
jgi:hypothetical protein